MNEQKNVDTVRNAYAAFGRGDIEALLGMFTEDIDWQFFGPEELPMTGQRKGKPEVARFFKQVGEHWNFERFDPNHFVSQGDDVVALGAYAGTSKTTGRKFSSEWAHLFVVKNGKIAKFREYADTANLLQALAPATTRV